MNFEESLDELTPKTLNELLNEAVMPEVLEKFNRGLKYLGIPSAGHFILMNKDVFEQDNFIGIRNGRFEQYLKAEWIRIGKSCNFISLIKFKIGERLFKRSADNVSVQLFIFCRFSKKSIFRLIARKMFMQQQRITAFIENSEVLDRMLRINDELEEAEQLERKLKKDLIIQNSNFHIFESKLKIEQISILSNLLSKTYDKTCFIDKNYCGAIKLIFLGEVPEEMELEFPVKWNQSRTELIFLFYCLENFDLIPYNELKNISSKLASNFIDKDGKPFKKKTFSDVAGRNKFGINLYDYQKSMGGRYKILYSIVQNVAKEA